MARELSSSAISSYKFYSIDNFTVKNRVFFISGWIFFNSNKATSVELILADGKDKPLGVFKLDYFKCRPDVYEKHNFYSQALNSGFVGYGMLPSKFQVSNNVYCKIYFSDDKFFLLKLPNDIYTLGSKFAWFNSKKESLSRFYRHVKKFFFLLSLSQFSHIYSSLKKQLKYRSTSNLLSIHSINYITDLVQQDQSDIHLVIDHNLGGGANKYRENLELNLLEEGSIIVLLTYNISNFSYIIIVKSAKSQRIFTLNSVMDLRILLLLDRLNYIVYNTAVSFVHFEKLPDLLLELKYHFKSYLKILLHDYFALCPSHFLLNNSGKFCNIPEISTCKTCLASNQYGFTSLHTKDISTWRNMWKKLLISANSIEAFSQSSANLLLKAYNNNTKPYSIIKSKLVVKPHVVDYIKSQTITSVQTNRLMIGVMGQIGFHKGAQFIKKLANSIEDQSSNERIVIIGSIEESVNNNIVSQTGPFNHEQLSLFIQNSNANIFLLPSIWPETFSYVAEEVMHFNLPIACFNYGAPAERIQKYHKGIILTSEDPLVVLSELRLFFNKIYFSSTSSSLP